MEHFQLAEYFYNGFWRLDFGFGNPNKTAVLLGQLALVSLVFFKFGKFGKVSSILLSLFFSLCIVHTFSRGGMLALLGGFVVVFVCLAGYATPKKVLLIAVFLTLIAAYGTYLGVGERFANVFDGDRSVSNRIEIWKHAPDMMVGAPGGWGLGKSGESYMRWYQDVEDTEEYRTLVNSHLTWLVEFGWPMRVVYVFTWMLIFAICVPRKISPIPFAVWLSFFIASVFSSVAEEWTLWLIPSGCLLYACYSKYKTGKLLHTNVLLVLMLVSTALILLPFALRKSSLVHFDGDSLTYGRGPIYAAVLIDINVLGRTQYAKTLRQLYNRYFIGRSIMLIEADKTTNIPFEIPLIVCSGGRRMLPDMIKDISPKQVSVINPCFDPPEYMKVGNFSIIVGEFARKVNRKSWSKLEKYAEIEGMGDFCPNLWDFFKD